MAGDDRGVSPFESIRREDEEGNEYWSARDLARVLGYTQWRNFMSAVEKASAACANSGQEVSDHFADTSKMIATGKGAQREVEDVHLSRYACYLVVQNADPSKEIVALGQTYFAVQTRRQEQADALAGLSEDQRRPYLRDQVAEHNRQLAVAAGEAGVVTARDFAIFQDHGYIGLYGGERARDIHARKGLRKGQHILDHMGAEELADNLFREVQAEARLRREGVETKAEANRVHHEVGAQVRRFIIDELGGTPPDQLPTPAESIQQVERREQRRIAEQAQPALFADEDDE
jgi:DNA-damage-inducible protein D